MLPATDLVSFVSRHTDASTATHRNRHDQNLLEFDGGHLAGRQTR
jgi:hypothetical protein